MKVSIYTFEALYKCFNFSYFRLKRALLNVHIIKYFITFTYNTIVTLSFTANKYIL